LSFFFGGGGEERKYFDWNASQGGKNKTEYFSPPRTEQTQRLKQIKPSKPRITHSATEELSPPLPGGSPADHTGHRGRSSGAVVALRRTGSLTPPRSRYRMAAAAAACPGEAAPASARGSRGVRVWGAAGVGSEWPRGSGEWSGGGREAKLRACWLMVRRLLAASRVCL
jgi:hypothetical protein